MKHFIFALLTVGILLALNNLDYIMSNFVWLAFTGAACIGLIKALRQKDHKGTAYLLIVIAVLLGLPFFLAAWVLK